MLRRWKNPISDLWHLEAICSRNIWRYLFAVGRQEFSGFVNMTSSASSKDLRDRLDLLTSISMVTATARCRWALVAGYLYANPTLCCCSEKKEFWASLSCICVLFSFEVSDPEICTAFTAPVFLEPLCNAYKCFNAVDIIRMIK